MLLCVCTRAERLWMYLWRVGAISAGRGLVRISHRRLFFMCAILLKLESVCSFLAFVSWNFFIITIIAVSSREGSKRRTRWDSCELFDLVGYGFYCYKSSYYLCNKGFGKYTGSFGDGDGDNIHQLE